MNDPTLVSFPLPVITALLCSVIAVLVWRLELGLTRATALFSAFFGLCAVEALLVGLRFGYAFEALIPLQRTLPLFVGPVMYLGFVSMTVGKSDFPKMILRHLGAPIVIMAMLWVVADDLRALDWVISGSYLIYTIALGLLWRKGPDALIYARVDITRSLSNWILRGTGLLVFILLLDTTIALDFILNQGSNVSALISFGTMPLIIILLAILITLPRLLGRSRPVARSTTASQGQDAEIEANLRKLLQENKLFLDPEITVQRLARRLHIPSRNLSAAINRTQQMNVSQYVNEFRLAFAADLLVNNDASVSHIATQSGFMTRSNFYREFQRVFGQSPSDYRNSKKTD